MGNTKVEENFNTAEPDITFERVQGDDNLIKVIVTKTNGQTSVATIWALTPGQVSYLDSLKEKMAKEREAVLR